MDRKLQHKHHSETVEEKRDKRRVAQNGRKDTKWICVLTGTSK